MSVRSSPLVSCDQAVFTSVRSPTGEGYRVVAASSGVRPEEKAEITRRSPSHDSLDASSAERIALSSYRLATGRHCVSYHCHAGREHTSRGGQRVYTHLVLLDGQGFARLGCDPVRVHSVVGEMLAREGPILKPLQRLERLTVNPDDTEATGTPASVLLAPLMTDTEWIWAIAAALLDGTSAIVLGAAQPVALLRSALMSIPLNIRKRVAASARLKFSPSRQMQLVLLNDDKAAIQRLIKGRDIQLWQVDSSPPPANPSFEPWFNLLRRWWNERRFGDLVHLTTHTAAGAAPADLSGIAARCEAADREDKIGQDSDGESTLR